MLARSLGLAALLGALLFASPAAADDLVRVKLVYAASADPTCPEARGFRDLVTSRMGYDPFRDDAPSVVDVRIELAKKGALVGTVSMATRRELVGREGQCAELAQALAVALAILLDPFGEQAAKLKAAPPPAEAPAPPPREPAPPPAPAAETNVAPPPNEPAAGRADVTLSGLSAAGLLPFPALGAGARIAYGRGILSGGAGARFLATPGTSSVDGEQVSGSLVTGVLDGCATFRGLSACVVASAGSVSARAETVSAPVTRSVFFFDVGARLAARVPLLSWLSLEAFVEGRAPLTQTELYVDGKTIFRSTAVTGTLGVGPVFQIY